MARRAPTVIALIAALLGMFFMTSSAHALSAVRTSSFEYYADSGLLKKEIIEPGNSQLCLVTEYEYDTFGNKTKVTTRNCDGSAGEAAAPTAGSLGVIASRSTASEYDARGQFAVKTTNALNHSETRTFDERFGGVKKLTGPNGLATSWDYDGFGRKIKETRADGTWSSWRYLLHVDENSGKTFAYAIFPSQSSVTHESTIFYDSLNRKISDSRVDMAETWIVEGHTVYDSNGRIARVYPPYEQAQFPSTKYTSFEYDILGRVIKETAPDGGITIKAYDGLSTTVTNAKNQKTTTVKNTQGQTVTVTDAMGKSINYLYDPFGNLTKTTDALGYVTLLYYDTRGRKVRMDDPDMGSWYYYYNALGELVRQQDAKGQIVNMLYDKLGRMIRRSEPDLISSWEYDGPKDANGNLIPDVNGKGVGKLYKATSGNGYSRTHSYDTLGRLSSTSTVIDNPAHPYVTSTTYDNHGRVDTQTYPASPGHPTGFAVQNQYNSNGYLIKVVNAADTTKMYWQADAMDAMGHLTQQTYGNGLVTQQTYYADTGRLKEQFAGAGNAVQNMSYQYDKLGNLDTRTDVNNNLTETYLYDDLNRVTSATATSGAVSDARTYAYDAIGNITSKSDLGGYSYNAQVVTWATYCSWRRGCFLYPVYRRLPHAVSSITGTINGIVNPTFAYDLNGNMLNGAGRSITWTSFNMPSYITRATPTGNKIAAFWYNGEHERTKEVQADGSIVITLSPRYDTGLHFEKKLITNPATKQFTGAVEYEHYLYAGGQMFGKYVTVTATDGVTLASAKTTYYSKDHLGSIVAITDEAGAVVQRLSYDVWGKRRYPNGTADPNGLLNNPDMYHGYTGHEMLDDVGLIHMNGRLYDPLTGRFMSADPHIQDPLNLQSYNRYAYCMGNPMVCNDPSGYFSLRGLFRAVVAVAAIYYAGPIMSWAGGSALGVATSAAIAQGAVGGAIIGYVAGGTIQSTISGGLSGAMFGGIGDVAGNLAGKGFASFAEGGFGRAALHAAGGGLMSKAMGGDFMSGAMAAGFAELAGPMVSGFGPVGAGVARMVIGGTASVIGGGKFENGAITAAYGYLFNCLAHECIQRYMNGSGKYKNPEMAHKQMKEVNRPSVGKVLAVTGAVAGTIALLPTGIPELTAAATLTAEGAALIGIVRDPSTENFIDLGLGKMGKAASLVHDALGRTYNNIYNAYEWSKAIETK